MSQCGLEGVTLGVLAHRVGMLKSGLFARFKSKDGVQISLLEHTKGVARSTSVAPAVGLPRGYQGFPHVEGTFGSFEGSALCRRTFRKLRCGGCPKKRSGRNCKLLRFSAQRGPL